MFDTVLAYATSTSVLCALTFAATLVFSTKIKDFLAGTPAEARAAATALEAKVKADLAAAKADVLAKYTPSALKPVVAVPVAPPAPVAPVAAVVVPAAAPVAPHA